MGQEPTITLSIRESGERPNTTYLFHILLDGKALISNQSLSLPDSQAVREISAAPAPFSSRAAGRRKTPVLSGLWERGFLTSGWPLRGRRSRPRCLGNSAFAGNSLGDSFILNFPWELLLHLKESSSASIPVSKSAAFPAPISRWPPFQESYGLGPCACSLWPAPQGFSRLWTTE